MINMLPPKGTARPIKQILGWILLAAGLGLVFMPDTVVPILCGNKIIFGIIVAVAGYFHAFSGRQL
jgi:hypothetical protein